MQWGSLPPPGFFLRIRQIRPVERTAPKVAALTPAPSLVRFGLESLLKFHKDFEVVGGAGDGEETVRLARELRPDVIVMDLMMPILDGVEATQRIHAELPEVHILILTSFGTSADVSRAPQTNGTENFFLSTCSVSSAGERTSLSYRRVFLTISNFGFPSSRGCRVPIVCGTHFNCNIAPHTNRPFRKLRGL
jgi:CheY-like chemotaxis protein